MRRCSVALAALLAGTALPALAQSAQTAPEQVPTGPTTMAATDVPPASDVQDDIVVTAQKRDENIQDVPISIQAIGTRRLDQLGITNFNEYTALLPSVAFQTVSPGVTTVYMRGVANGGDGNHSGSLPSVGTYLDEQPVTTIGGTLDVHIYDVARIESLAGPQGTLYGASSESGTIRIITNKPDLSGFYGRVDVEGNTVAHGGQGGKAEGMLNIPVTDRAALRVVGFYQRDAGYIDNVPGRRTFCGTPTFTPDPETGDPVVSGCIKDGISVTNSRFVEKNYNDTETYGGRAALKIDLDDTWTVTPTVLYQEQRSHGTYAYDPSVGDLQLQHFYPEYRRDRYIQGALTIEGKIGTWDVTYAGAYLDRRAAQSSDYTDYAEAYDSLYESVGGLANYFYYQDNAGNTIDPRQNVLATDHFKKLSQELRVASPASEPFRVVVGAFYQRQSNLIHQDYAIPNLGADVSVNGFPGTLWLTQQHRVDKDYAMFGEVSWDVLPRLTLTAGGRGYIYDNSLIGFFGFGRNPNADPDDGRPYTAFPRNAAGSSGTGVAGCFLTTGQTLGSVVNDPNGGPVPPLLPAAVKGSPCTNLGDYASGGVAPRDAQGQGVTYRFNASWKPTDDLLFYGTWSRGFRPGGINRRGDLGSATYGADFLTNYEIGAKTTLLGGKLRLNGDIYEQHWNSFQFSFLGENSFTIIQNGPDARIRGVEADANLNLGRLNLTAAGAYTDAVTRQNLCTTLVCPDVPGPNDILAPKGTRLPITPRFKITGTGRYTIPIGAAKAYVQGLVTHQSSATADLRVAKAEALGRIKGFTYGNLALGAEFGDYTVELFAQNIWDERAQLSRFQQCGACDQRPYIVVYTPRTLGLRAGAKF
jgi:iron complex outermembrane receptor protein